MLLLLLLLLVHQKTSRIRESELLVGSDKCDQIGRLLKVLGNKFAYKCSPKRLVTFWAI